MYCIVQPCTVEFIVYRKQINKTIHQINMTVSPLVLMLDSVPLVEHLKLHAGPYESRSGL